MSTAKRKNGDESEAVDEDDDDDGKADASSSSASSVTSEAEKVRVKRRKKPRRHPFPTADERKAEADARAKQATSAQESESKHEKSEQLKISDVFTAAGIHPSLTVGRLDDLRRTRPDIFDRTTPSRTPPIKKVVPEKANDDPQLVRDLIANIKQLTRVEIQTPSSELLNRIDPPERSAFVAESLPAPDAKAKIVASSSAVPAAAAAVDLGVVTDNIKRAAIISAGVIQLVQATPDHVQKLSHEGGLWHTPTGRRLQFPVCKNAARCIVNRDCNLQRFRIQDAVTSNDRPMEMMAWLTPTEYTQCESGKSLDIVRQCIWCECFEYQNMVFMTNSPYASNERKEDEGASVITIDGGRLLQHMFVSKNCVGGFLSKYTVEFLPQFSAVGPAPMLRFDIAGLILETVSNEQRQDVKRRRLNIAPMVYRDSNEARQPRPGTAESLARHKFLAQRQAELAQKTAAAAPTKPKPRNFKSAGKAPGEPSLDISSRLFHPEPASVDSVLSDFSTMLRSWPASTAHSDKAKRTEKEAVERACKEHFLRASDPQLLYVRHEAAKRVETLFAKIQKLLQWSKPMLASTTHRHDTLVPLHVFLGDRTRLTEWMNRLVTTETRETWRPRRDDAKQRVTPTLECPFVYNVDRCRFDHLLTRTVDPKTKTMILEYCQLAKRTVMNDPRNVVILMRLMAQCDASPRRSTEASYHRFLSALDDRHFLNIARMIALLSLQKLLRDVVVELDPVNDIVDAELKHRLDDVHHPLMSILDVYWFVPYALLQRFYTARTEYEQQEGWIDPHWDSRDPVNDHTMFALDDCVENSLFMPDSKGGKYPFVHILQKLRLKRSQTRMIPSVFAQYVGPDPRFRWVMCQWATAALLGSYFRMSPDDSLPFHLRCFVYRAYQSAIAGGDWKLFEHLFSDQAERFMTLAGQQYVFNVAYYSPALTKYFKTLFPLDKLSDGVDAIVRSFRVGMVSRSVDIHRKTDGFKTFSEIYTSEEITRRATALCLTAPYPKVLRGFLSAIASNHKKVRARLVAEDESAAAASSLLSLDGDENEPESDTDGDEDEEEEEEEDVKLKRFEEDIAREAAKSGGIDPSLAVVVPTRATGPSSSRVAFSSEKSFGLTRTELVAIWRIVDATSNRDRFPERYMYQTLDALGTSPTAQTSLLEAQTLFEHGKKEMFATLLTFARTYPRSYAIVHAFSVLHKRHSALRLFPLPAHYVVNQIRAIRARYGLLHTTDVLPAYSCELLVCPVCLSVKNNTREPPGKTHYLHKDGGFQNIRVDLDPLRAPRAYCNGVESFAGVQCSDIELVRIPLLGYGCLYRNDYLIHCPQPSCSVLSIINPHQTVFTEYGCACSDCSIALIGYTLAQHERGYVGITDTHNAIAANFRPSTDDPVGEGKRKTRARVTVQKNKEGSFCDICQKNVTKRVASCAMMEFQLRVCGKHRVNAAARAAEDHKFATVVRDECKSSPSCLCDNLKSTCDGKWNRPSVIKYLTMRDSDVGMFRAVANLKRDTKKAPKTKTAHKTASRR